MYREFNLWISGLASGTKILERKEEEYMMCRNATDTFVMTWKVGYS
jgi:hypothetical protein